MHGNIFYTCKKAGECINGTTLSPFIVGIKVRRGSRMFDEEALQAIKTLGAHPDMELTSGLIAREASSV